MRAGRSCGRLVGPIRKIPHYLKAPVWEFVPPELAEHGSWWPELLGSLKYRHVLGMIKVHS